MLSLLLTGSTNNKNNSFCSEFYRQLVHLVNKDSLFQNDTLPDGYAKKIHCIWETLCLACQVNEAVQRKGNPQTSSKWLYKVKNV